MQFKTNKSQQTAYGYTKTDSTKTTQSQSTNIRKKEKFISSKDYDNTKLCLLTAMLNMSKNTHITNSYNVK